MRTKRVLIADFDFFTAVGGGQTFYRRVIERNPSMVFFYPSKGPDFDRKRKRELPWNAEPFLFNTPDLTGTYRKLFDEDGNWVRREFGAQWAGVAAALRGQHFDVLDIPAFYPIGFAARPVLSAFDVQVDRVVLSMLGWQSTTCRSSYDDLSEVADAYEREEIAGAEIADIRYVISNLEQETSPSTGLPVEVLDMQDTIESIPAPAAMPPGSGPPALWYVGRLDGAKGPDLFIEIVSRLPKHLYSGCFLAGPDNDWNPTARWSDKVIDLAKERGVEASYVGRISDEDLRGRVYGGRTVIVVPSRTDAFNYVALEALRHGCPILLSIKAGANGFLKDNFPQIAPPSMDPDDLDAAARSLTDLLQNFEERARHLRAELRANAFREPRTNFMRRIYGARTERSTARVQEADRLANDMRLRMKKVVPRHFEPVLSDHQIEMLANFGVRPFVATNTTIPKVSIVIPVYNGVNFFEDAIQSALAQDYPNFEVIVVDDGSTDDTPPLVAKYASDPRVISIRKKNGGVASALNVGIEAMSGHFFCWLSHDDRFHPHKLSRQVERFLDLDAHEQRTVLISDYDLIDATGALITTVSHEQRMAGKPSTNALMRGLIHGCSVLIPRDFFREVGKFNETLPYTQDYDLWGRSLGKYKFVHMAEALIQSRWHDAQGSKRGDFTQEADALWLRLLDRVPVSDMIDMDGSEYGFYAAQAGFLREAAAHGAAAEAVKRAEQALDRVKVSVIIPFYRGIHQLKGAIYSALSQTHRNIEVIVVYDEPDQDMSEIRLMPETGYRVFLYCQNRRGAGEARNYGINKAKGEYIAFLDADDLFLPYKVRHQLAAMQSQRARISHTSYLGLCVDGTLASMVFDSGTCTGNVFPGIIANCPIAMPTVMAQTSFIRPNFMFPENAHGCEDFLLWIRITKATALLGIAMPLSVVHITGGTIAHDPAKQKTSLEKIIAALEADPELCVHVEQINHLRGLVQMYEARAAAA